MKKKLNDEEIIAALENCNSGFDDMNRHSCATCPYREIEPCGKAQMTDCIDLIRRQRAEIERLRGDVCPICGYLLDECQCRYGGSGHPNRDKEREVVLDHLYLLNDKQLKHIINLEKSWRTSYGDNEKKQIVKKLGWENKI